MSEQESPEVQKDEKQCTPESSVDGAPVAPQARGVSFDNIPPLTSQKPLSELSSGGEDTSRISMWVAFDRAKFVEFGELLDKFKSESQQDGRDSYILIGNTPWEVQKSGFHLGMKEKGGPYYRWQLRFGGIRFGLANRSLAHKRNGAPNVWLEIGSEILMVSGGVKPVYDSFVETLNALGGKVIADVISEMHVCADLPEVDIGEFTERYDKRYWISRAKLSCTHQKQKEEDLEAQKHSYGLNSTGFTLGTNIQICVYEKRREVEHSITKKAILEAVRWGGPVEKAVRVEFKFRRETLKSRGIDSIADWELKKPGFIAWLVEDWFRMTEGEVDRTHTSRAQTWQTWKIVQALFADWAGKGPKPPKLGMGIQLNPRALIEQAVGCITQAMALRGMDAKTMPEFLDAALRLIKGYSVKDNVLFKLDKKFASLGARSPRKAFFSWGR